MQNKIAALIMATFVATPVMAQNVDNQVFANQNMKAIELSHTEMQETQGEWAPQAAGAFMGAAGGHFSYMAGAFASGSYNPWGHAASVATGAGLGALSPIKGAHSFAQGARNFAIGVGVSGINNYANTMGTTYKINR
ncbi:hypothetical protein [Wielerella bovis]|uniref:hypothetical protein n=1 Tax=Wielerella bovis TaxID=2917790 RepID=UPI002018D16B|nr:hypothetical protein [Wielerella bovis]MCG7656141.1 hypothetical protein [Wielerella bovis]MCG7658366.1 hypothetical protein [Wielerella bovis]